LLQPAQAIGGVVYREAVFAAKVNAMFEGDYTLRYHLAPPLLSAKNDKGELRKTAFGPWVRTAFKVLAPFKVLRGGVLDVFGYSEERRQERALILEYVQAIESMLPTLALSNRDAAAAFARVPEHIRGFGHVKARHLAAARVQWVLLQEQYQQVVPQAQAA
jgi:indolepyruvate ferredoxin oxidoreductase